MPDIIATLDNAFLQGGLVLMLLGMALALARPAGKGLFLLLRAQLTVSLEVLDTEPTYEWLGIWLSKQKWNERARRVVAENSERGLLFSPAPGVHMFTYRGRAVWLTRERRPLENAAGMIPRSHAERMQVRVVGRDPQILRELLKEAGRSVIRPPGEVRIHIIMREGWHTLRRDMPRPLDSIVLPGRMTEEIEDDVRQFLEAEDWYRRRGIPWRRGYLLHGPPGTGKTSLISSLAGALGLDLYLVNLSGNVSDEGLSRLLLEVPPRSAVVLEDIDAVVHDRKIEGQGSQGGVTFAGLLNALDGVVAAPGQIRWLTTNHPERLDPALVRPGRVDRDIAFGYATRDQIERMTVRFFAEVEERDQIARAVADRLAGGDVTPAEVQSLLMRSRSDPLGLLQPPNAGRAA